MNNEIITNTIRNKNIFVLTVSIHEMITISAMSDYQIKCIIR